MDMAIFAGLTASRTVGERGAPISVTASASRDTIMGVRALEDGCQRDESKARACYGWPVDTWLQGSVPSCAACDVARLSHRWKR